MTISKASLPLTTLGNDPNDNQCDSSYLPATPDPRPCLTDTGGEPKLIYGANGELKTKSVSNAKILTNDHFPGTFCYNEFSERIEVRKKTPWAQGLTPRQMSDLDATELSMFLEAKGLSVSSSTIFKDVIPSAANTNKFNPLVRYLDGLTWDKTPRNLVSYLRAAPSDYHHLVCSKFLIAAVARVYQPGVKVDTMLILEGKQGRRKSTFVEVLFGAEYFTGQLSSLNRKDSNEEIRGIWGVEMPELNTLKGAESDLAKEFISRRIDRFRVSYGRSVMEYPRKCVFIGTTNDDDKGYLRDATGARRYWPVRCGATTIDIDGVKRDRDQIWAEAVSRFKSGEKWWLDDHENDLASSEQEARFDADVWEPVVEDWLAPRSQVTASEVLEKALGIELGKQNKALEMRVTAILSRCGFRSGRFTNSETKKQIRGWARS